MFPDAGQATTTSATPYENLLREFVGETRGQLATLTGEIALRNKVVQENDAYVYGEMLANSIKIEAGHDFTPVNWLRRVCEIHRTETMGDGFKITSTYHGVDENAAFDPDAAGQLQQINNKKKTYSQARNNMIDAIMRDNGGYTTFARMVENASAVGDSILKCWYDENTAKYRMDMIEAMEHFYAIWNRDDFRSYDATAYVYQISKQEAVERYGVPEDIATSPLGLPLAVLSSANTVNYISTQPMVTVMEVNGRIQGWGSENADIKRVQVGHENLMNVVIVGDRVFRVVDDPKYLPKYYIFPNKLTRRRPWGLPDITHSAININATYIEALSDWRTVSAKVNFPKYKGFGFGLGVPTPKQRNRTIEILPLGEGQDVKPLDNPATTANGQRDFQEQMAELKEAFVRETGISAALFENPDGPAMPVKQAASLATQSLSDQVKARRQLWEPIIKQVFMDAFDILKQWDDNIREAVEGDPDWYLRVSWPPMMRKDDPSFVTMVLNQSIAGFQSIQTMLERLGFNAKEEIDRINDEMNNPLTAAMHGKMLQLLAEFKIAGPPTSSPPKVAINLSGVLTPEQEANLSVQHEFGSGPIYGPSAGPQGELGVRAINDSVNAGRFTGTGYSTGQPEISGGQPIQGGGATQGPGPAQPDTSQGGFQQPAPSSTAPQATGSPQPQSSQTLTPPDGNQPGTQVMNQPGSGQPSPNTPQGNINQQQQRSQKKQ